ncbi:MAG: Spy/CpxP family protein refolding chaperone [Syntrophales bacterium]|jgi:hypothetical protein|nr:Spy/CpxP family protein refolding chaperone [Syntrophales bacterium]
MKLKAYQVISPATVVVVMAVFLSALFLANGNFSFAASVNKKASAVVRASAVEHAEAQIKQLQGELSITKVQEELWINFTGVMRENAKEMDAFIAKVKAENTKTKNAVESMKFHSEISEIQLEQLKKLIPPFEAFYSSMSDEQKKSTDAIFRTGRYGKSKRK